MKGGNKTKTCGWKYNSISMTTMTWNTCRMYIVGDGAPWIVAGCRILEKSKFVLDKFHIWKYIQKSTNHLLESTEDARELIYETIRNKDLRETERLLRKCAASAITERKQKESKTASVTSGTTGWGLL